MTQADFPKRGDRVFDVVLLDEEHVWTGWHVHGEGHSLYPGGISPFTLPDHAVSRAYLKAREGAGLVAISSQGRRVLR